MKTLIAAACICIIAATAYWIGGDYLSFRSAKKTAFLDKCNAIVANPKPPESLRPDELRRMKRLADDCLEYMRSGKVP